MRKDFLFSRSLSLTGIASILMILQACGQTPEKPAVPASEQVPEITLNLPADAGCTCVEPVVRDYTFLDKGFAALADGDYEGAIEYFERYRRLDSSAEANWEAGIAVTFIKSLEESPFFDPRGARRSYRDLYTQNWQSMEVHQQTLLLQQALENFRLMHRRQVDVERSNAVLKEDLEKRDEAIKRLRELTLGQKGAAQ
jgi:tetratricopeptide (TPR) repeat protein